MVVNVYISGISGNKEVKKRQQRVLLILDSKNINYEVIDIAEPDNEEKKDFMQNNSTSSGGTISDPKPRHPLPPQIFNNDLYCGDYEQFDLANEIDEMEKFLKLSPTEEVTPSNIPETNKLGNGEVHFEEIPKDTTKDESEINEEATKENNEDDGDIFEKNGEQEEEDNQNEDE